MKEINSIQTLLKLKPYRLYAVFLLAMLLIPSLMIAAWNTFQGNWAFDSIPTSIEITVLLIGLIMIYAYLTYYSRDYLVTALQQARKYTRAAPIISATLIGALFALLIWLMMLQFPPPPSFTEAGMNLYLSDSSYSRVLAIICVVLIAPLMEEYIFRGYIFDGLRHKSSMTFTFVTTSVLFVLPHMLEYYEYWPAAIMLFSLGILLAYFRERYQSLVPCIALHASYNLSLVFVSLALNSA